MNLVPYVDNAALTKKRDDIYAAAKGRQLTLTEAFTVKNLSRGIDITQDVLIFNVNGDSKTPIEEQITQYLEEKTGFGAAFMRVQADPMAIRLFIPLRVYNELRANGVSIPSNEVLHDLKIHGMDHATRFLIVIGDEKWIPIISTYAKMFKENKLSEFDWWIRELIKIRDRYMQLTQPKLSSGDIAHENKTDTETKS